MAAGGSTKVVLAALIGNSLIALAKYFGAFISGSAAMLAEAIHSTADAGNQGLLLFGSKAAKKRADAEHQFGYGRERYFWSFVVALILFALGSAYAVYEGINKILHPHEITNLPLILGILVFAIIIEFFAFRTAVKESIPLKGDMTWWQFIRRCKTPELPVVLLEDLGAMVGLIIAFTAISLTKITGIEIFDGIGTLAIGILLGIIAIILIIEMRSLLLGEGAEAKDMDKIKKALTDNSSVTSIIHMKTQYLGPEELLVAAKVSFKPDLSVSQLANAIDDLESAIRSEVPYATPIYIEPDLKRSEA